MSINDSLNKHFTLVTNVAAPMKNLSTSDLQADNVVLKDTRLTGDTYFSQATETSAHLVSTQHDKPVVTGVNNDAGGTGGAMTNLSLSDDSTDVAGTIIAVGGAGAHDGVLAATEIAVVFRHLYTNSMLYGPKVFLQPGGTISSTTAYSVPEMTASASNAGSGIISTANALGFLLQNFLVQDNNIVPIPPSPGAGAFMALNYFVVAAVTYPPPALI